jgi:hypothetical protein
MMPPRSDCRCSSYALLGRWASRSSRQRSSTAGISRRRNSKNASVSPAGIAYGLVGATFVWEAVGALLDVPAWPLDLSPFHHVGLVPAESFHAAAAVVMVALAGLAAAVATWGFDRRDLAGA